jgi:hypothetical protein
MLVAKEVDGIEMGVLDDGTPFLTGRGLAKACGVVPSAIIKQADSWRAGRSPGGRLGALGKLFADAGYDEPELFVEAKSGGRPVHAYTDSVSTIVIGYYAFDVDPPNPTAINTSRILMRGGLRQFIYRSVGYDPRNVMPRGWREFHDRLLLATCPPGGFSVFREMSEFILRAAQNGLILDSSTVPDISVGKVWSIFWTEMGLAAKYGERKKHEHCYPPDYPQSLSNPQDIWVYPIEAVGAFRRWLDEIYIPEKFPKYLGDKVKKKTMSSATAMGLLAAVTPARLEAEGDEGEEGEGDDGLPPPPPRRSGPGRSSVAVVR